VYVYILIYEFDYNLITVEAGGSFFPTKAWCVFDEENGLSALKIVIGF